MIRVGGWDILVEWASSVSVIILAVLRSLKADFTPRIRTDYPPGFSERIFNPSIFKADRYLKHL